MNDTSIRCEYVLDWSLIARYKVSFFRLIVWLSKNALAKYSQNYVQTWFKLLIVLQPFLDISDIRDTFNLLDTDNDGRLTKNELATLLRYTGSLKSEAEMDALLEPIDTDRKFEKNSFPWCSGI